MNDREQDRISNRTQARPQPATIWHENTLFHELKTRQIDIENQLDEMREKETKLREELKRYADLYEYAPMGLIKLSAEGRIREVNLMACCELEATRRSLLNRLFADSIFEEDLPHYQQHCEELLAGVARSTANLRLRTSAGKIIECQLLSTMRRHANDGSLVIHCSIRNLKGGEKTISELQEAYNHVEASSIAKSLFLANMSHEMRTPLSVIIGFTDLLLKAPFEDDKKQSLKAIHRNSLHLLNLIDDLLDLAKIESGKLTMEILPFNLAQELQTIMGQFINTAETKGINLFLTIDPLVPEIILTDPIRFRQIILNVLNNALKFTNEGKIEVALSLINGNKDPDLAKTLIGIDVIDTGCGIASDHIHHLFKAFTQADITTARRFGGTGLGLCLSRRFAEALGGDVEVLTSEVNVGSTFRITIDPKGNQQSQLDQLAQPEQHQPRTLSYGAEEAVLGEELEARLEAGTEEAATLRGNRNISSLLELGFDKIENPKEATANLEVADIPSLEGIKILVVEDALDNQVLIKMILESAGAEVECAEDGVEAYSCILKEEYDVVLMDIQLPLMDGYEATTQLRSQGCVTPIIALTAHALKEDRRRAESAGFDGFVSKPINWHQLTSAIVQCRNGLYH